MTEQECLAKMIAPGTRRKGKYREGVIQIHITRACDNACYNCTQGSNLGGKTTFMDIELFEQAVLSLKSYWGVVGIFGGNPALHPKFPELCGILRKHIPFEQCGLWCNHPHGHGAVMRETFNPHVSNLNVHMNEEALIEFKRDWPESMPFGFTNDSRHSPCYVAMKDVLKKSCDCVKPDTLAQSIGLDGLELCRNDCEKCRGTGQVYDKERAYDLISKCDINQHWSAMIGQFRGQLRAWFCEIAGAQAMLHQHEPDYPDTGIPVESHYRYLDADLLGRNHWWELSMKAFAHQVRKHCHECGVPLKGHGELAMSPDSVGKEQCSTTHESIYKLKRPARKLEVVTELVQLGTPLSKMTNYLGNAKS